MSDLGQLLKKARTERGLSLDDVQDMTKIRKRYLEAIEDGNYKILPGNFYVRAFIKTYSEAVGLEPNEVLRLYRNVIPAASPEEHLVEPIRRKSNPVDSRKMERAGKWASSILLWSFVLLILSIIYYFINITYEGKESEKVGQSDRLTDKIEANAAVPLDNGGTGNGNANVLPQQQPAQEPPEPPKPVVTFVSTKDSTMLYSVTNVDSLSVELKIVGDQCWLHAKDSDANGTDFEQKTYRNGDTPVYKSDTGVWIRLGKPLAVEIKINGTAVSIPETVNPLNVHFELKKT